METKQFIINLAKQIIIDRSEEVEYFCDSLKISKDDILNAWVQWDTGITEYDNSIYSSYEMRVAMHLHNYIPDNWHDKRQRVVLNFLIKLKPKTIADIGFGSPQRYVTEYVLKNDANLTLFDFDDESLLFAKVFLSSKAEEWENRIRLQNYDMDSEDKIGSFDCYLFQDSIEHTKNPTKYLSEFVSTTQPDSHFIFSIPIEVDKAVPEHNIFWENTEDALSWLENAGLSVQEHHEIEMNKKLDLFANFLHPDFKEIVVHAVRK